MTENGYGKEEWLEYYSALTIEAKMIVKIASLVQLIVVAPMGVIVNWAHASLVRLQLNAWRAPRFYREYLLGIKVEGCRPMRKKKKSRGAK